MGGLARLGHHAHARVHAHANTYTHFYYYYYLRVDPWTPRHSLNPENADSFMF